MRHRTSIALILLLVLFVPTLAQAQRASRYRVDGERAKSYIEHVSTDEMLGRQSLTPGYRMAADWAAERFREWGLQPAGDDGTFFQSVPIERAVVWTTGLPELAVGTRTFDLDDRTFTMIDPSTPATRVSAGVVFVGYGISAPDKGLDEYAGLDVRGKVLLMMTGSPADAPEPRGRFGPAMEAPAEPAERFEAESADLAKMQTAFQKGAAAVLFFDPDAEAGAGARGGFGRRQEDAWTPDRPFLAFRVEEPVWRTLLRSDDQETPAGVARRLSALRVDIKRGQARSQALTATARLKGYDAVERFAPDLGNNTARNVLAKIPGTDRRLREQYVIIGGHFDHLGVRNGYVYNGADDNASGSAVTMEVARVLAEGDYRPRRTIVFALWCGEELGLLGSQHYADNPPDGVAMDRVVTYVNMDMVGLGDRIGAPGALNFPEIWEVMIRDQEPDVISVVDPRTGGPGGSDHSAFIVQGIQSLALMTSGGVGHPDYHQPEDDTAKIEPEILRKTGQFVLQAVTNLADERRVELLIPDRVVRYNAVMLRLTTFNPALGGSYRHLELEARDRGGLIGVTLDSALAIASRPQTTAAGGQMGARGGAAPRSRKSVSVGVAESRLFGGDVDLLVTSAELLGFGRLDISGDDGYWFTGGRLSPRGREALRTMEANDIALHLVSPSTALLRDVLAAATRPFIVTGRYTIEPDMVAAVNEKQVLLGVAFDPREIAASVRGLNEMKALMGDVDNLVLSSITDEGIQDAAAPLYLALIEAGWTHEEIAGSGGRGGGGGIAGGNLARLGPAARMMGRR